ncbi:AAA family ATPase [Vibrio fluvialis]|uniref:AAA family ATPase n=1 Tax=Vibrio fluvialis TaxID=676 RepID=UPI003D7EA2BB
MRRDYFLGHSPWDAIERIIDSRLPHKLICASTSQFEKFSENWRLRGDFIQGGFYAYIGSKPFIPNRLPSTRIASTALNQLLARDTYDERKIHSLRKFLLSFGFGDVLKISLESSLSREELDLVKNGSDHITPETQIAIRNAYDYFDIEDLSELTSVMEVILSEPEILLLFDDYGVRIHSIKLNKDIPIPYSSRELANLLMSGLVSVADIETVKDQKVNEKGLSELAKVRPLGARSSGEQCLFLLFLGIISSIDDDALILIDEPEISLHPSWQQKFVEILHTSLNMYSGCHFIIATHSPLIVSDISVKNCQVLDMATHKISDASKHSLRSSDYHLATLFHNPGHSNEYLIKTAVYIFSKVKMNKSFDEEDIERLQFLNSITNSLAEDDPVNELVSMLNEVYAVYG